MDGALDFSLQERERNRIVEKAHREFLESGVAIRDVFGRVGRRQAGATGPYEESGLIFAGRNTKWTESFVRDGYCHFPGLIDEETVAAAKKRVDDDLAVSYDPARKIEYENRTFCPGIVGSDEIMALLADGGVQRRVGALVRLSKLAPTTTGQIAIRKAHSSDLAAPPHAHVDGFPTPHNGVGGDEVVPFTMLVGVFLTAVTQEFAGNFTVWPGSHRVVEEYFKKVGPEAKRLPLPMLEIGSPKQLLCEPGDVVLSHYHLAHTAAVNTCEADRYAIFFRLAQRELVNYGSPHYRADAWRHLTGMWDGWRVG